MNQYWKMMAIGQKENNMAIYNDVEYKTLPEQVQENKERIEELQLIIDELIARIIVLEP